MVMRVLGQASLDQIDTSAIDQAAEPVYDFFGVQRPGRAF